MDLEKPTNAREQMPSVTEFVDSLRKTFGKDEIDNCIRQGLRDGSFFAVEGRYVIGKPPQHVLDEHGQRLADSQPSATDLAPVRSTA